MLYFVYHADRPNALDVRQAARADHLAYIKNFDVRFAGPTLNEATGDMDGSVLIVELPDAAAAHDFAKNDPYARAGLFASSVVKPWKQVIPSA